MKVMDAITEILKREDVSTMFCFPTTPIIESAAAAGIRPVICRQERVGVHMADGCTRVMNGKPAGVFAMQYGPGAENAFAGIASAYSDSTPLLLLPLGHPRESAEQVPALRCARRGRAPRAGEPWGTSRGESRRGAGVARDPECRYRDEVAPRRVEPPTTGA